MKDSYDARRTAGHSAHERSLDPAGDHSMSRTVHGPSARQDLSLSVSQLHLPLRPQSANAAPRPYGLRRRGERPIPRATCGLLWRGLDACGSICNSITAASTLSMPDNDSEVERHSGKQEKRSRLVHAKLETLGSSDYSNLYSSCKCPP